ncbi:MAG: OmpA family protein, partial [Bacteroidota bacterium]
EQAIDWFQRAYDNGYGVDALRDLAYAQKQAELYDDAIRSFKELGMEIGSPYEYRRDVRASEIAQGWKAVEKQEYSVELLELNTGYDDYSPTLFKDNQLVFSSDRSGSTGEEIYNWTGNAFSDLYVFDIDNQSVKPFDASLNTPNNEGTNAFTADYQEMYFTRCAGEKKEDAYCKIMKSSFNNGAWSSPEPIAFFEENDVNVMHPALSKDGNTLYFTANHPDGWGGYDIYICQRQVSGDWSEPKLMSRNINTIGDEQFPFVDADTLYFSSNFQGMGGLDIYRTFKINKTSWGPAFNLKPPINSGGDDFGYVIDYNLPADGDVLHRGYFSSTRNEGIGGDDIYRFVKRYVPPPPKPEVPEEVIVYKMVLEGYVLEKIYDSPNDPDSKILGRKPLEGANVKIEVNGKEENITVGEDGYFKIELEEESDYDFTGSKTDYLTKQEFFSSKGIGKDPERPTQTFEIEIVLEKIFYDKEITLENIYYDFNESYIRDDAKPILQELAKNLKLNPDLVIQMGSHTDCRGGDNFNADLSQRRAQSAVDYLIEQGIEPQRLIAKGYGEGEPAVDCICNRCSEDQHQENRRTTFKILQ